METYSRIYYIIHILYVSHILKYYKVKKNGWIN